LVRWPQEQKILTSEKRNDKYPKREKESR